MPYARDRDHVLDVLRRMSEHPPVSTVEGPSAGAVSAEGIVDGHRVGVTVQGAGEPVVLLHGIGRDRADWNGVLPVLARSFRVIAVDVEGFGESPAWGTTVTLASMARMVRTTVRSLGEHRPLRLVGNSMGGAVALRMVADDPEAFAGLVLLSPAGFGRDASIGLRLLTAPLVGPALLRASSTEASRRLSAVLDRSDPALAALAAAASRRLRAGEARRAYLQVVHDLGAWRGIHQAWRDDVLAALADSGVPTLVLWGDRDTVLPHAHLASVVQSVPHAVARSLPGVGHMPQLEDPERTAEEISAWFSRGAGPASAPPDAAPG